MIDLLAFFFFSVINSGVGVPPLSVPMGNLNFFREMSSQDLESGRFGPSNIRSHLKPPWTLPPYPQGHLQSHCWELG